MDRKSKAYIYLTPLGYALAILPVYLFVKYILKLAIQLGHNLELYAIVSFLIMYVAQVFMNVKTSNLTEDERFELLGNQMLKWGNLFSFFVSLKGAVFLILFVSILLFAIFKK